VLVARVGALALTILLPLAALRAPAQQSGGAIAGSYTMPAAPMSPRHGVTAALADSQRKEFAVTGRSRPVHLPAAAEGAYSVTVEKQGFARLRLDGILVKAGQATTVQPVLNPGQVARPWT